MVSLAFLNDAENLTTVAVQEASLGA